MDVGALTHHMDGWPRFVSCVALGWAGLNGGLCPWGGQCLMLSWRAKGTRRGRDKAIR